MKSSVVRQHARSIALLLVAVSILSVGAFAFNPPTPDSKSAQSNTVGIPGPLRSFLRMAGISQKASAEEVAPLMFRLAQAALQLDKTY